MSLCFKKLGFVDAPFVFDNIVALNHLFKVVINSVEDRIVHIVISSNSVDEHNCHVYFWHDIFAKFFSQDDFLYLEVGD